MNFNCGWFVLSSFFLFITGCATPLTTGGSNVYITPSDSSHLSNCELLGQVQVTSNNAMLWDRSERVKDIKYRLRDATANQYPNADTVAFSDTEGSSNWGPNMAMGTVFRCKKKHTTDQVSKGNAGKYDKLSKLKSLLDDGVLTKEEFIAEKKKILSE